VTFQESRIGAGATWGGYTDTMRTLTEVEKPLVEHRLEKIIEIARKQRLSAIKKWA
jgi:hypothetical protein